MPSSAPMDLLAFKFHMLSRASSDGSIEGFGDYRMRDGSRLLVIATVESIGEWSASGAWRAWERVA